ncbi:MFS transporter [Nocardia sp. NPDC050697]|uniref:MFS transporter n=1 Tax=Nocardia sp. NPDC050697 TaxID=3155158 RepID=UPI0033F3E228
MMATRVWKSGMWMVTLACLALALVVGSMAALYTALPDMAVRTGADQHQLTWIVDGYTLTLACLVLLGGALGDRYGRRTMMVLGLIVFAAASAVPLFAEGPTWIIAARCVCGAGAALVMPSTLSLLTANFGEDRRGLVVGVWAGVAGVGAMLGILGSGLLLRFSSWTSIFVAMSLAGVALALASFSLPESQDESRPPVDLLGALTSGAAVGALVLAAVQVPLHGWTHPAVLVPAALAPLAAAAFVAVELRVARPLLDVRLFADRGFGAGTISVTLQFLVSFGVFMVYVQFLQLVFGYSPLQAAFAMAPMMIPMMVLAVIAPKLAERFGLRILLGTGLAIIGAGLLLLAQTDASSTYGGIVLALLVISAGVGLSTSPATAAIVAGTPEEQHGVAAAVNDAAREVGAAVGIAIAGSILAAGYAARIDPVVARLPEPLREPVSDSLAAALAVAEQAGPAGQPLADAAVDAFVHGAHQALVALGAIALVTAAVVGAWAPGSKRGAAVPPPAEPERKTGQLSEAMSGTGDHTLDT